MIRKAADENLFLFHRLNFSHVFADVRYLVTRYLELINDLSPQLGYISCITWLN